MKRLAVVLFVLVLMTVGWWVFLQKSTPSAAVQSCHDAVTNQAHTVGSFNDNVEAADNGTTTVGGRYVARDGTFVTYVCDYRDGVATVKAIG